MEIDKLNNTTREIEEPYIDFEEYFSKMDLPQSEIDKRIEMANDIKDDMMFLFLLIMLYRDNLGMTGETYELYIEVIIGSFKARYEATLRKYFPNMEEQLQSYVEYFTELQVTRTLQNMEDDYYLSDERTYNIGANEANVVGDLVMFEQAKQDGKTKKKWIDMRDNRERKTHLAVGGTILPIDDYFTVGKSKMLFPHDYQNCNDEAELSNCRCSIHYF
jgi:hypothetical protein